MTIVFGNLFENAAVVQKHQGTARFLRETDIYRTSEYMTIPEQAEIEAPYEQEERNEKEAN